MVVTPIDKLEGVVLFMTIWKSTFIFIDVLANNILPILMRKDFRIDDEAA